MRGEAAKKLREKRTKLGTRYGSLTTVYILDDTLHSGKDYKVHCVCDCGNEIDVWSRSLYSGDTTSCGCRNIDTLETGNMIKRYFRELDNYDKAKDNIEHAKAEEQEAEEKLDSLTDIPQHDAKYYMTYNYWTYQLKLLHRKVDDYILALEKQSQIVADAKTDADIKVHWYQFKYPYADNFKEWEFDD